MTRGRVSSRGSAARSGTVRSRCVLAYEPVWSVRLRDPLQKWGRRVTDLPVSEAGCVNRMPGNSEWMVVSGVFDTLLSNARSLGIGTCRPTHTQHNDQSSRGAVTPGHRPRHGRAPRRCPRGSDCDPPERMPHTYHRPSPEARQACAAVRRKGWHTSAPSGRRKRE